MPQCKNVDITLGTGNSVALGWEDNDRNRYHVWLDPVTFEPQRKRDSSYRHDVVLFKRPPADRISSTYDTRYLNGEAAGNAKMIAQALSMIDVGAQVAAQRAEQDAVKLEQAERNRQSYIKDCQRQAGPTLYGAALSAITFLEGLDDVLVRGVPDILERLRAAVKEADSDARSLAAEEFL